MRNTRQPNCRPRCGVCSGITTRLKARNPHSEIPGRQGGEGALARAVDLARDAAGGAGFGVSRCLSGAWACMGWRLSICWGAPVLLCCNASCIPRRCRGEKFPPMCIVPACKPRALLRWGFRITQRPSRRTRAGQRHRCADRRDDCLGDKNLKVEKRKPPGIAGVPPASKSRWCRKPVLDEDVCDPGVRYIWRSFLYPL